MRYISLYIIKRFRRRRVKNREGGQGGGGPEAGLFYVPLRPDYSKSSQGRIILSPPKARNFWVCLKFGFVRSLGFFDSTDSGF